MLVRAAVALLLVALLLPGCSRLLACDATGIEAPATASCRATPDGWHLQGASWNASATRLVVLVHGLNEDHHSYDVLGVELAARGWHVVAFDSRGMGRSTNLGSFVNFTSAQYATMDHDLDAVIGTGPAVVVGASVGSSEALRWAARAAPTSPLVLLSPGLGYHDLEVLPAARSHTGPVWMIASPGDEYSARSVARLAQEHRGPHDETILPDGTLHGTQLLQDATLRASIVAWIDAQRVGP